MQVLNQIIIIEDNAGFTLFLKENLAQAGISYTQLKQIQSVEELADASFNYNPDVIFLEVALPNQRSLTTFNLVNQQFTHTPIIILSGINDLEFAQKAIRMGAQDFLFKDDIGPEILSRTVAHSIERKNKEIALQESENRLRTILDTDPESIKLITVDCEVFEINKAGLKMIEADDPESVKGMSLLSIVAPAFAEQFAEMIKNAFAGIKKQMQFEMHTLKGKKRWCEINLVPYYNAAGKIILALGVARDITRQKADEEELKHSNERFLMIASTTNDAIWEWDLQTGALWANEMHQHLYGLTIHDPVPVKEQWEERIHPNDREGILAMQDEALASQTNIFISEYRFRKTQNEYIHIFDRCYIVRNNQGEPVRMTGSMMDISEQKKAEEIIRRSNERFELIAKTTNDAIWETDLDTGETWGNEMHQQLYGLTMNDPVPNVSEWEKRIHPHEREDILQSLREALDSKENIWINEYRFLTVKDKWINIYDRTYILRNEKAKPVRLIGSMMDISERKKVEKALQQSEEKYRTLVEQATDGIFIADQTGRFHIVNTAGLIMSGYSFKELRNMTIYDLVEPEDLKTNPFRFAEMRSVKGIRAERKMLCKDGSITDVEVNAKLLSDDRFLAFIRDITDRKKAEEELKTSYRSIRKLTSYLQNIREEERTHIAREIHDELGQQLTVLKMDLSWLNKRIAHYADDMVTNRMNEVLNMLNETVNAVRRISSDLRPSLLDDLGLIAALEWQLSEFQKRSGIQTFFDADEIELNLSKEISTGLFRILQESLTNVVRHAQASEIRVYVKLHDQTLILQIEDNGAGFEIEKIKSKKTLGILGMQERTLMMGGQYSITSNKVGGTVVKVTVPLSDFLL